MGVHDQELDAIHEAIDALWELQMSMKMFVFCGPEGRDGRYHRFEEELTKATGRMEARSALRKARLRSKKL